MKKKKGSSTFRNLRGKHRAPLPEQKKKLMKHFNSYITTSYRPLIDNFFSISAITREIIKQERNRSHKKKKRHTYNTYLRNTRLQAHMHLIHRAYTYTLYIAPNTNPVYIVRCKISIFSSFFTATIRRYNSRQ